MSSLSRHPAYVEVDDVIDAVGQRLRVYRLLRGAMLFVATGIVAVVVAAVGASVAGPGGVARTIGVALALLLLGTFGYWVVRPLLFSPSRAKVAQLIESKVDGLHNGLTNLLQLAEADDLEGNPWLDPVFREIATNAGTHRLQQAVGFGELRRPAVVAVSLAVAALILAMFMSGRIAHGLSQIVRPDEFVPTSGVVQIEDVQPGDTTVIKGHQLEISVSVKGDAAPVVFLSGDEHGRKMSLLDANREGRRYGFVMSHVDESMQYRVEAGGTQTRWYDVSVIRQVGLTGASITVTPPAYTKVATTTRRFTAEELHGQAITCPQGSRLQIAFELDAAIDSAMLQVGDDEPIATKRESEGRRFSAEVTVMQSAPLSLLLADSAGQIIARIPEKPVALQCTTDAAPSVEMIWPQVDTVTAPEKTLRIAARVKDDIGLSGARLLWSASEDEPMKPVADKPFADRPTMREVSATLDLSPETARHGASIWVQVEATDDRQLTSISSDLGPQQTVGRRIQVRFQDPAEIAKEELRRNGRLREVLEKLLAQQRELYERTNAEDLAQLTSIRNGQSDVRTLMLQSVETIEFGESDRIIQKTLQVLAGGAAREAVDIASAAMTEMDASAQRGLVGDLRVRQRRIIQALESMLAVLREAGEIAADPAKRRAADLENPAEEFKKLQEALEQFIREEQRILEQSAGLAKKPVDNFDENDRKLLEELKQSQEKLDAFMQQKVSDFSNVAEQDMANASMLRELLEIYTEVTMAKGALSEQMVEMAISHEEMALELAKEMTSNIEKFLLEKPDRLKWTQEDQLERTEAPMAELPMELEDLIGELMEEQEDLFEDIEDANANWHDALDKGAGWDAMDGPISNMNAQGVTGNTLPNNNEMSGRSGEGRSGKSQGEMVEETATGKGGRNTPTRLDPTAFQQGQIKDVSTDPVGGATGGGKLSGQGGAGLEGPAAPKMREEMERLRQRQAELRNSAERLNLQYQLGSYDSFKMLESVAIMRRMESDLRANRYQNALRRKDILLDRMDLSRTLLAGSVSVQHDTTPASNRKLQEEIYDAMQRPLPPAWEGALKEYYRRLGQGD